MLRVFTSADAARAVSGEVRSLILQLPGDLTSKRETQLVRNRVWQQAKRKHGTRQVSVTPVGRWGQDTLFVVKRCAPPVRHGASVKAEVFLACTVGGLSRSQAAEKYGIPRSTVTSFVQSMRRTRTRD